MAGDTALQGTVVFSDSPKAPPQIVRVFGASMTRLASGETVSSFERKTRPPGVVEAIRRRFGKLRGDVTVGARSLAVLGENRRSAFIEETRVGVSVALFTLARRAVKNPGPLLVGFSVALLAIGVDVTTGEGHRGLLVESDGEIVGSEPVPFMARETGRGKGTSIELPLMRVSVTCPAFVGRAPWIAGSELRLLGGVAARARQVLVGRGQGETRRFVLALGHRDVALSEGPVLRLVTLATARACSRGQDLGDASDEGTSMGRFVTVLTFAGIGPHDPGKRGFEGVRSFCGVTISASEIGVASDQGKVSVVFDER